MEDEIKEFLEKIYNSLFFKVEVIRKENYNFEIKIKFLLQNKSNEIIINYYYERFITFEANIDNIEKEIDKGIINILKINSI